jgi:hypothetical protein
MVHINLVRSKDDFKYTLYEREFSTPLLKHTKAKANVKCSLLSNVITTTNIVFF